jgi:hypothetical protein
VATCPCFTAAHFFVRTPVLSYHGYTVRVLHTLCISTTRTYATYEAVYWVVHSHSTTTTFGYPCKTRPPTIVTTTSSTKTNIVLRFFLATHTKCSTDAVQQTIVSLSLLRLIGELVLFAVFLPRFCVRFTAPPVAIVSFGGFLFLNPYNLRAYILCVHNWLNILSFQ